MAEVLGDNATLDQAGGATLGIGLKNARVKVNVESYTFLGSEGSGDTFDLGAKLPKSARILQIILFVDTAQSSLTFKLGDDADDDRYVAAGDSSLQTAGTYVFSGKNYKTGTADGDTQIVLTSGGATATAGQFEVAIIFAMD